MSKNQEGAAAPRLRIVDTKEFALNSSNRNKRRNRHNKSDSNQQIASFEKRNKKRDVSEEQWPLEASPILRSVLEYGRRTASLSALNSSRILANLATKIRNLGQTNSDLEQIVIEIENEADKLKLSSEQIYESDD